MASINIDSKKVIHACKKTINEIKKAYCLKHPTEDLPYKDHAVLLKKVIREIEKIEELAEYQLKPYNEYIEKYGRKCPKCSTKSENLLYIGINSDLGTTNWRCGECNEEFSLPRSHGRIYPVTPEITIDSNDFALIGEVLSQPGE